LAVTQVFDKALFIVPIHCHGNHWTLAVINLLLKRFEYYDSLRGSPVRRERLEPPGSRASLQCPPPPMPCKPKSWWFSSLPWQGAVLRNLRQWLVDESKDKRKQPLDLSDWKDITFKSGTPQQHNGAPLTPTFFVFVLLTKVVSPLRTKLSGCPNG
jgi:Ulp1 family protease